jgi:hypothetical protein
MDLSVHLAGARLVVVIDVVELQRALQSAPAVDLPEAENGMAACDGPVTLGVGPPGLLEPEGGGVMDPAAALHLVAVK